MTTTTGGTRRLARVVSAGVVGTTVEFYDFFLHGAATATIFGPVFFPHQDGLLAVLLALVTYTVGFAARPLGGLVFGHFGDRVGRKRLLRAGVGDARRRGVVRPARPPPGGGHRRHRMCTVDDHLLPDGREPRPGAVVPGGGGRPAAARHDDRGAIRLLPELFGTSVRYSGVSVGYQAATVFAGAAAPLAGAALLRATHSAMPVAIMLVCCLALTVVGMSIVTETARSDLAS
ncbi:hypothetical protein [Saccharopolyspora sp. ASAGF58]|uniref:hypothetical protein n=1 Tax=Saccharopolyspora sp. ASAGF58 TaxID=2719023 RepID=UPI001FF0B061|nr:hypothetical protein [Saccharopolyspora sp. ASAGF58]